MRRALTLILGLTLVAAACGSDDSADTVATTTSTTVAATTTTTTAPPATTTTAQTMPEGITFTGADGVEQTITDSSTIISLNGDITEILFELGVGDRIVAVDVTSTYPPQVQQLGRPLPPARGFLVAEPVIGIGPALVIGDQQVGPPEVVEQIRAAGIPVAIIELQNELSGIRTKIETVAMLVGEEEAGAVLADRVDAEIDEALQLAAQAANTPGAAFVYARGPEALLLFGPGSVTSALITGANAIDTVLGPPVGPLTPEGLAAANPDVLITTTDALGSLGGPAAFAALPGVAQTTAGQEESLLVYDDALFLGFGPRTGEALMALVLDLHPELAENS
ncbi:MAG: heme/hemin ABC transporter substrate-binding protein [Acidimicrobiia bacterium]